jgi:hypothetical protein
MRRCRTLGHRPDHHEAPPRLRGNYFRALLSRKVFMPIAVSWCGTGLRGGRGSFSDSAHPRLFGEFLDSAIDRQRGCRAVCRDEPHPGACGRRAGWPGSWVDGLHLLRRLAMVCYRSTTPGARSREGADRAHGSPGSVRLGPVAYQQTFSRSIFSPAPFFRLTARPSQRRWRASGDLKEPVDARATYLEPLGDLTRP